MSYRDTAWATLEQWSPTAFLAGGGLFALPAVADGFEAVTGTGIALPPVVIFVFLLVVFVALLGLYPRLAERDSGLAKGGLGLLAVTATVLISAVGAIVLSTAPPFGRATVWAIIVTVAVGSTLTVATFGLASLLTGAHSRPVGGFLLVVAAAMAVMIGAMVVYGHSTPTWMGFVVNGLVATSLGSIGYVLRTADIPTETVDSSGDVTAS